VAAAVVVVLLLFLLRPSASHLKTRLAGSIGGALARQVEIGTVHIRLLPQPGFDLQNLVVYDDPAFSAEPMLRAPEVIAVLRLTSLARGRLEIARLNLTEPSLNLVLGANGRWNLEALLERASRTPLAPTAKSKSEPRAGFPYIEASTGRINFKNGAEKKPYALTNADFALWQESENAWGVRLKAQPLRADLNLSDTGLLSVNGTWQRAGSLRETPLQFSIEWNGPQLGQVSRFFTGSDRGWRGMLRLEATLHGTPAQLQVSSDASIQDFRRYDISSGQPLVLAAHCDAEYSSVERTLHDILCSAPVGTGAVTLRGDMGSPGSHTYHLTLAVKRVPVSSAANLARRAKKDLPVDLVATGIVDGSFTVNGSGSSGVGAQFEGRGEIASLRLSSASNEVNLDSGSVPLLLTSRDFLRSYTTHTQSHTLHNATLAGTVRNEPHFEFGPLPVTLGRPAALTVRGWINWSGYDFFLTGEGEVSHTLRLARLFGLPALRTTAEGTADLDLQISGAWLRWEAGAPTGFSAPELTGTARLQNVRAKLRGLNGPVEISSAQLQLSREAVRVDKLSAAGGGSHWTGSLSLPRGCGTPGACLVRFNLSADEIAMGELSHWLNPSPSQPPWYRLLALTQPTQPSFLGSLRASGRVNADRLLIRDLAATHVSAGVEFDGGKLRLSDLRGEFMGGKHRGELQADFTLKPPVYIGTGTLTGVSLGQLADAMRDGWIAGTASGSYQLNASGVAASELWRSAEGTLRFDIRDGLLAHVSLASGAGPLQVDRFLGQMRLHDGGIDINDGTLDSSGGAYQVSGTVTFDRELAIKFVHAGSPGYNITGTVEEPLVAPANAVETRAQLKP
jgi:AsmA-like protein